MPGVAAAARLRGPCILGFNMRLTAVLPLLLTALHAAPAFAEDKPVLVARGNEPSWRLILGQRDVMLQAPPLGIHFMADRYRRQKAGGQPVIVATDGRSRMTVTVEERLCTDSMTGMPYPLRVAVAIGDQALSGCGGETMTVVEGGWRVIRLGDDALPDGAVVTVSFAADGRVAGRSGCNRFTGAYALTGEGLSFDKLAATRMACPEPLMDTEMRFFRALGTVTRLTPDDEGRLRLMAGDREVMLLDRAE